MEKKEERLYWDWLFRVLRFFGKFGYACGYCVFESLGFFKFFFWKILKERFFDIL